MVLEPLTQLLVETRLSQEPCVPELVRIWEKLIRAEDIPKALLRATMSIHHWIRLSTPEHLSHKEAFLHLWNSLRKYSSGTGNIDGRVIFACVYHSIVELSEDSKNVYLTADERTSIINTGGNLIQQGIQGIKTESIRPNAGELSLVAYSLGCIDPIRFESELAFLLEATYSVITVPPDQSLTESDFSESIGDDQDDIREAEETKYQKSSTQKHYYNPLLQMATVLLTERILPSVAPAMWQMWMEVWKPYPKQTLPFLQLTQLYGLLKIHYPPSDAFLQEVFTLLKEIQAVKLEKLEQQQKEKTVMQVSFQEKDRRNIWRQHNR
eukprot:Platyproteum_vivax@DN13935_c0_g1_i1.p1